MDTKNRKHVITPEQYTSTKLGPLRAVRPDGDSSEVKFDNFTLDMVRGVSTRVRMFQTDVANPPEMEYEAAPEGTPHSPIPATGAGSDLDSVRFEKIVVNIGGKTFHFYPTGTGGPDPRGGVPVDLSKGLETLMKTKPGDVASHPWDRASP